MHLRNDWTRAEIQALYQQPFLDLVFQAQQIHRQYFEANAIQVSTLKRMPFKSVLCCRSKQENALKTANTVHSLRVMTQSLKLKKELRLKRSLAKHSRRRPRVLHGFVWARHGEIHMSAICLMSWIWCVKSKLWV